MGIILVGANHRSAPVGLREKLAFSDEGCSGALKKWLTTGVIKEGLILSTCNRVEVVAVTDEECTGKTISELVALLSEESSIAKDELEKHLYTHTGEDAVRHLFRVASSLDSMVVGEPQILGQFRKAYSLATDTGAAGTILNKVLPHALHTAKRVRNETDIANSAVSVSYMAVELGRRIFESLKGHTALVVGGGATAELVARHLIKSGVGRVLFTNRTQAKSEQLAENFGGRAVPFSQLAEHLAEADIVICSTSSPNFVITPDMVRAARKLRQQSPIFLIDISVPRNVDPQVGEIQNSFVFNIDDLRSLVLSNIDRRQREAERAKAIVEQEVVRFREVLRALKLGPAITRLREQMQQIAREELARQREQLALSKEQEDALEELLLSTIKTISHPIITQMRRGAIRVEL